MRRSKPILSIEDQIKLLKSRGLIFSDENNAESLLEKISYQKIFAYRFLFYEKNNIFYSGTKFEDIFEIYKFDSKLRNLMFEVISFYEVVIKTQISNHLGTNYGIHSYLETNFFDKKIIHDKFLLKLSSEIESNQNKSSILKSHYEKYDDDLPIYKVIEILTFGTISKFYGNLEINIRKNFGKKYYPQIKSSHEYLKSWLYTLLEIRNDCAHNSPIITKKLMYPPKKLKKTEWDSCDLNHLWGVILVLKEVLNETDEWTYFKIQFKNLIYTSSKKDNIIKSMKFPTNWEKEIEL